VTLMRTTADECHEIGAWIAEKLNACDGPLRFLIPEKGISAPDTVGGPFFDPDADAALFDALESGLRETSERRLIRLPLRINDPSFRTRWSIASSKSPSRRDGQGSAL
jgi:uncharacterized protein (UPF0261 family)